jgi:HK97 family phage prohead protease
MERKLFAFTELKADTDARTVEGWASTFGNTDLDNDIIAPGAFADSIKAKMPKLLWQHQTDQVIGIWNDAKETEQGLYVKGTILDTTLGNDAYKLAKAGAIDSMSIGFSIKAYSVDRESDTRTIEKVDLWEVSLVTFPANPMARIMGVKAAHGNERDFENFLREAGYSRDAAKIITAKGFKALGQREVDPAFVEVDPALVTELTHIFNQFKQ